MLPTDIVSLICCKMDLPTMVKSSMASKRYNKIVLSNTLDHWTEVFERCVQYRPEKHLAIKDRVDRGRVAKHDAILRYRLIQNLSENRYYEREFDNYKNKLLNQNFGHLKKNSKPFFGKVFNLIFDGKDCFAQILLDQSYYICRIGLNSDAQFLGERVGQPPMHHDAAKGSAFHKKRIFSPPTKPYNNSKILLTSGDRRYLVACSSLKVLFDSINIKSLLWFDNDSTLFAHLSGANEISIVDYEKKITTKIPIPLDSSQPPLVIIYRESLYLAVKNSIYVSSLSNPVALTSFCELSEPIVEMKLDDTSLFLQTAESLFKFDITEKKITHEIKGKICSFDRRFILEEIKDQNQFRVYATHNFDELSTLPNPENLYAYLLKKNRLIVILLPNINHRYRKFTIQFWDVETGKLKNESIIDVSCRIYRFYFEISKHILCLSTRADYYPFEIAFNSGVHFFDLATGERIREDKISLCIYHKFKNGIWMNVYMETQIIGVDKLSFRYYDFNPIHRRKKIISHRWEDRHDKKDNKGLTGRSGLKENS